MDELPWHSHPVFMGVFLKHVLTGDNTGGCLSCHLVKVAAGHAIGEHIHENQWELHEVIAGSGTGMWEDASIPYERGRIIAIAKGKPHAVKAGNQDLYLLATFCPALV